MGTDTSEKMQDAGEKRPKRKWRKNREKQKKQRVIFVFLAVIVIALCVGGILWYQYAKKQEILENAMMQEQLKQENLTAMMLAEKAEKSIEKWWEGGSLPKSAKLKELFSNAGIQEIFHNEFYYTPEETESLIEEGKISSRKTVKEVLMVLTQETLPAEDRTSFLTIESCQISAEDSSKVKVEISVPYVPISDDDYYYLFELETFETEHGEEYADRISKWTEDARFSVNLNHNSSSSRLFSKFVVAVLLDGKYVDISRGHYITNPEAVAKYTSPNPKASSIKGLIVDPAKISGSEIEDLGVKYAAYNIPIGYILGETSNATYPTVYYNYQKYGISHAISIVGWDDDFDKNHFKLFHDRLKKDYMTEMSGDMNVLFKMKELWFYMINLFLEQEKVLKKIRKAKKLVEYDAALKELF